MGKTLSDSFPDPDKLALFMNAGQELLLHDLAIKRAFRSEAATELQTGKGAFKFSECLAALIQVGADEQVMSSLETLGPNLSDMVLEYRSLCDFLDTQFEFSENIDQFVEEFTALLVLFFYAHNIPDFPEDDIPKFDLAIMKALFQAGKVIERLKTEGVRTSDDQSRRGAMDSTKHVGKQAVFDAFDMIDWKGQSLPKIGELIEDYLKEIEQKKPKYKQKTVYSDEYIYKNILPSDQSIRGILLKDGILKE